MNIHLLFPYSIKKWEGLARDNRSLGVEAFRAETVRVYQMQE